MSRASSQQRPLSLTEELERLEQSITLTLQEIDHNFSRAHRIVTTSILPIVEQYAEHSRGVWEGSKFWKQFFEASANVSLSGYEEQPSMQAFDETVTDESHTATHTTLEEQESYETPSSEHISLEHHPEDLDLSNLTLSPSQSTPRAPAHTSKMQSETTATFAEYPSPYEALRREVTAEPQPQQEAEPITPGKTTAFNDISMTPDSSPFMPTTTAMSPSGSRPSTARKNTDPLLHHVLDKNYRVAATPMTSQRSKYQYNRKNETTTPTTTTRFANPDFSSSPAMPEAPQLNTEVFDSPIRGIGPPSARKPRTPGVSVLTPGRSKRSNSPSKGYGDGLGQQYHTQKPGIWDSDSDSDLEDAAGGHLPGMSPPKTFQFHIPQSRLLKTPAREASKMIVRDILQSAGASVRTPRYQTHGGGGEPGTEEEEAAAAATGPDAGYDDLDPEFDLTGDIDFDQPYAGKYDWEDDEDGGGGLAGAGGEVTDSPSVVKGRGGNLGEMTF